MLAIPAQIRPALIAHSYVQDDGSVGVVALTLNKGPRCASVLESEIDCDILIAMVAGAAVEHPCSWVAAEDAADHHRPPVEVGEIAALPFSHPWC